MAAAYYLQLRGHQCVVYEAEPEQGGMLRYGIPQYRLPKVEVLEAEYEAVWRLGAKLQCNMELGRDFTLDDLQNQGFDSVVVAIGCYDTNKLGIPNEDADGVIDGLEYLRTATLGLPYPGHEGTRVVVIGGGFTAMDCVRTSVRQGAGEVTLVYRRDMKDMPAASEVHEAIEEGVTTIFQAGPTRVITDEQTGRVTGVEFIRMQLGEPDASGRRRPEPAPGTEFTIDCDRVLLAIGQGPDLRWIGPGSEGPLATKQRRLGADAVTFETARPGVFGTGDVRIGAATVVQAIAEGRRAAYAVDAYLRGQDLAAIRTRQTLAEPQPEFLSIVPFTGEVKEPRYRLKALEAEARNRSYIEYEIPYSPDEAVAESTRCLQCTCEAIGFCDLRRLGIEYGTTLRTLEPAFHSGAGYRSVTENRFTGVNHDYIRDDSHAFILREPARCIDCGRCANVCAEVVGAACYDFMRIGFDTLVTTPLDMSLNDTPCVSCGRCAETCPTGALMPKPRVLQKYDVDESRCILCGICVDACPYDAVRHSDQFELSHTSREEPMIDLLALASIERETEMTAIRKERDWADRARAEGRFLDPARNLPVLPASLARLDQPGRIHGHGHVGLRRLLRARQHALGNGQAHAGKLDQTAFAVIGTRGSGGRSLRPGGGLRPRLQSLADIVRLEAVAAGHRDRGQIDAVVLGKASRQRRRADLAGGGMRTGISRRLNGGRGRVCPRGLHRLGAGSLSGFFRGEGSVLLNAAISEIGHDFADRHDVVYGCDNPRDRARFRRFHLEGHLLGLEDEEDLPLRNRLAGGLPPLDNLAFGHRQTDFRHHDRYLHLGNLDLTMTARQSGYDLRSHGRAHHHQRARRHHRHRWLTD